MSIANYLVNLTDGLTSQGVLGSLKGGTGLTTVGSSGQAIVSDGTNWVSQTVASGAPKVSQISYTGDNTAANPTGGETVTLTGTGFAAGARVLINQTQVGVVTVVSATEITFTAPALVTGSYVLYVVNTDGGTAVVVPGIQYSGVPSWTTAAGTLATVYETAAISSTVAATSDSAVSYSVISGALPTGATLAANGTISGTSPVTASSTTYTFTIRASDAENQETDRTFNLTINPDTVTWSSPANAATLVATPGAAYSSALSAASAAGQTVSYSADALPTGLAISGSTITGTPTTAGTSSTTLTATSAVTNRNAQVTISWTITVAADAYFPYTTLLLNSETVATPFLADASVNNFAVTVAGDTKPSNFGPYLNNYSYFSANHSTNYLSFTPNAGVSTFTGDFTIEAWVVRNTSAAANNPMGILEMRSTNGSVAWTWILWDVTNGSGNGVLNFFDGTNRYSANTIKNGAWFHVAITRQGSTIRQYINGVQDANTFTLSGTITGTATTATIGRINSNAATTGYISNLRVVNGTAVYTSTFTPPTQPLTAVSGTTLLTCQSNRFRDASTNNLTITRVGDAVVSSFSPFVPDASYATYGSTYFDGTGDYLSVDYNSAFNVAGGTFTIEAWVNITGTFPVNGDANRLGAIAVFGPATVSQGWEFSIDQTNNTLFFNAIGSSSNLVRCSYTFAQNTWYHIAMVRNGSTNYLFVNGISQTLTLNGYTGGSAESGTLNVGAALKFANYNHYITGYISNFRIVNGTALYTANFTPPTTPLTAVAGTSLLTLQTNQPHNNQTFLDNSTSAFPVTRTGNTTQGSFSPYGANWSNYFDGTGDWLQIPNNSALSFAAGNFTIEAWVNPSALAGTYKPIITYGINNIAAAADLAYFLYVNSTNYVEARAYVGGTAYITTSTSTLPLNTWTHLAAVRSSNTLTLYVNGVSVSTTTVSGTLNDSASLLLRIGGYQEASTTYSWNGYISNARIVKGTAVYTTNFTPSTTPLTAITGTSLLTCQSYNFTDNSLNALTLTKAGDVSVQRFNPFATVTQTPQTHSVYFNNSTSFATPVSAEFTFGTGAFTIEAWVNPSVNAATIAQWIYGNITTNTGNTQAGLAIKTNGTLQLQTWNAALATTTAVIPLNTWTHVAASFDGTTYRLFVNGVLSATGTTVYTLSANGPGTIGHNGTLAGHSLFTGHISNARVVKGVAVYTANFTPATTPLTAISGTVLLTCQDATIRDNSVNQFTLTATNSPQPRQQNPFGFTTSSTQDYSTTTFGGSGYFDGSSDYISIPNSASHATLPGDFSAECWFYLNNVTASSQLIFSHRTNGYCPFLIWAATTNLQLYVSSDNGSWNVINGDIIATVAAGQWYHLAYTRTGSTFRVFLNGIQVKTFSNSASFTTSNSLQLGMSTTETNSALNGYISDFRFVKGTGVYTANFVPPTAPLTAVQNTTLLLNMDKSAIADKSGKVVLETIDHIKLSTAVRKYGSSSMYFDGTGDCLSIPNNPVFNFGTGDFTVEAWIYLPTVTNVGIIGFGSGGFFVQINTSTNIHVSQANVVDLGDFTISPAILANTWYHLAMTRSGTSMRAFINGIQQGSTLTNSTNFTATNATIVGGHPGPMILYSGYMDDLRVTRGYARYTANFTPPSSALLTK